jgi:energy-coupling factor transporter transmembrane protein EcfT
MEKRMSGFYWWFGFCLLVMLAVAFLIFGIYILIISYHIENPLIFLPTFFSSSLMILVCLSLIAGLTVKAYTRLKKNKGNAVGQVDR